MKAEGWHYDPFGVHELRWFSAGEPTSLVRDGALEGRDEPPPGEAWAPVITEYAEDAPAPSGSLPTVPARYGDSYPAFTQTPLPVPFRQRWRRTLLIYVIPSVVTATVVFVVATVLGVDGAWKAAVVAVLPALYATSLLRTLAANLERRNRYLSGENPGDLYPR